MSGGNDANAPVFADGGTHRHGFASVYLLVAAMFLVAAFDTSALGVAFDDDDFIVAGYGSSTVSVYDSDFTYKGDLTSGWGPMVGLDFDRDGNVVVVNQPSDLPSITPAELRVFAPDGSAVPGRAFANIDLGYPLDVKVGPAGRYYVGTQDSGGAIGNTVQEFGPAGATLRAFGSADYEGVAVLPGRILWGGGSNGLFDVIHVWDLDTGSLIDTIALDGEQQYAHAMHYSYPTNTVLIADSIVDKIFERNVDGSLVQSFTAPGLDASAGVTRGPNGDVIATSQTANGVFRWSSTGAYLGFTPLGGGMQTPVNILWAGSVPEPNTAMLFVLGLSLLSRLRRTQRSSQ